jgi:hypothetical protein
LARWWRPVRCSSSGVVPSAFAMTAPRPKNMRAVLRTNVSTRARVEDLGKLTLSTGCARPSGGRSACSQPRRASSTSTYQHLLGPDRAIIRGHEGSRKNLHTSCICSFLWALVFFSTLLNVTRRLDSDPSQTYGPQEAEQTDQAWPSWIEAWRQEKEKSRDHVVGTALLL